MGSKMSLEENTKLDLLNMIENLHKKSLTITSDQSMLKCMSHTTLNNPINKFPPVFFEAWIIVINNIRNFYYKSIEELNNINTLYNTLFPHISHELTLTEQLTIAKKNEINILLTTIKTFLENNIRELNQTEYVKDNNLTILF
jgi:hypothetical protein